MSAPNPPGAPAPADGSLPQAALETLATTPFGVYVHVPFCAARCGYCDFNTYVPDSLRQEALAPTWTGKPRPAADMSDAGLFAAYVQAVNHELDLAQKVLGDVEVRTVYFGGGTPTLLPTSVQASILDAVKRRFRLAWDAEVSTEANPESVSGFGLDALAIAGFNRISLGMQSAVPRVLQLLDRRHTPGRVAQAVEWARQAGFSSVGVDLIYGSPTETAEEWRQSLRAAIDMGPDHVSAYSLTLEPGTRLERRVRSGEFEAADPDTQADYYQLAEDELGRVGLRSYEISNWAKAGHECRHNLAYWHSDNWWGLGPGAHSH
ncbi:MAG: radical SAM protein, partial [Propionibacteriaceae bacterium]|nr:radical SAM protein [Propionibacteriaceae bacterium]